MDTEAFIQWALDDARTVEERFTVELLVEGAMGMWHARHKIGYFEPYDERHERNRQRYLNPAYDPQYSEQSLRRASEVFADMKSWWKPAGYQERPIRDLQALRFMPGLEEVKIGGSEILDLAPLTALPRLRTLHFSSFTCHDFRPLAQCRQLRELSLSIVDHWPEISGLETLDQLETFSLSGNLLAFPPGAAWPAVRRGAIACSPLAVRSVRDLPCFPACEFLTLSGAERLDGIEKFPRLRNLTLTGPVHDFSPLTALGELTWLSYNSDRPLDVAPLARLPQLQYASFQTQHASGMDKAKPRDYSPLADAPALREIQTTGCPPVEMEVAAINAGLPPWDDLFLATEPRPLPPLRMIVAPVQRVLRPPAPNPPPEPEWIDTGIFKCEGRWVERFVTNAVSEALGHQDWGNVSVHGEKRGFMATIESFGVVEKLPEILDAMRGAMARFRNNWESGFMISLKAPKLPDTPAQIELQRKFREAEDDADFENWRRERAEYLERLHLYELKKQQGDPVDPEEFAAPAPLPMPVPPWEETGDEEADEDDGEGGIALKKKPEPPNSWSDDDHPLASNYSLIGNLTLSEAWFTTRHRDVAIYLMRREPDEEIPDEKKE